MIHDPKWKMRSWMLKYLPVLSVQDPKLIREAMRSNVVTFMGEKLKVEISLLNRLREAGELKREDGGCFADAKRSSKKSKNA